MENGLLKKIITTNQTEFIHFGKTYLPWMKHISEDASTSSHDTLM